MPDSQNLYVLWGNPVSHSISPKMHQLFAEQSKQNMRYEAWLGDLNNFENQVIDFFAKGGKGCNITAPFKERSFKLANDTTERCQIAKSCNTLHRLPDGTLLGDNTDGIGLVADLKRLNWLKPNQKILILGAGGATRGILFPLLKSQDLEIVIVNRTTARAKALAERFSHYGKLQALNLADSAQLKFDVVINATSFGASDDLNTFGDSDAMVKILQNAGGIYDLQYKLSGLTPFLAQIKALTNCPCEDGLGMLVAQGVESFKLWRNASLSSAFDYWQVLDILRKT